MMQENKHRFICPTLKEILSAEYGIDYQLSKPWQAEQ